MCIPLHAARCDQTNRSAADTRGAFVQPALYEAFGLTVIEAMTCGLPCFATNRGGPAEIIKNGLSGYHIECAPLTVQIVPCYGDGHMPAESIFGAARHICHDGLLLHCMCILELDILTCFKEK